MAPCHRPGAAVAKVPRMEEAVDRRTPLLPVRQAKEELAIAALAAARPAAVEVAVTRRVGRLAVEEAWATTARQTFLTPSVGWPARRRHSEYKAGNSWHRPERIWLIRCALRGT